MRRLLICSGFLFCQILTAQDFYYPLNVGDKWQLCQITPQLTLAYWDIEVDSDTLMPNGLTYAAISHGPRYQRQVGNQVLAYSPADSQEYVVYDFSASVGDTVGMYDSGGIVFDVILVDSSFTTLFGQTRREFRYYHKARWGIDVDTYQSIVDSFGLCHFDGFIGPYSLCSAVISGKSYGTWVSVLDEHPAPTNFFALHQNYPNPFNSSTVISFSLSKRSLARLEVFDLLGRRVCSLANSYFEPGDHQFTFDATSQPSGIYLCRLAAEGSVKSQLMVLAK